MDAEKQKAESGAEHQKKAKVFQEAELKVSIVGVNCVHILFRFPRGTRVSKYQWN